MRTNYKTIRALLCIVLPVLLVASLALALAQPWKNEAPTAQAEPAQLSSAELARLSFALGLQQEQSQYNFTASELDEDTQAIIANNLNNLKTANTAVTALGLVTKYAAPVLGKAMVRGLLSHIPWVSHMVGQYITGVSIYEVGQNVQQVYNKLSVQLDEVYNALSNDMSQHFTELNRALTDCFEALKDKQDMATYYNTMYEFATGAFSNVNSKTTGGYYDWVVQLTKDYEALRNALTKENVAENRIKTSYDNLYLTASQAVIIFDKLVPVGAFGGTPLLDAMYNYYLLNSKQDTDPNAYLAEAVESCINFAQDLYANYQFANTCLALCYRYQVESLTAGLKPGQNIEDADYYYTQSNKTVDYITEIEPFAEKTLANESKLNAALARFYCRVLNLDETYYLHTRHNHGSSYGEHIGKVIYHEVSAQEMHDSTRQQSNLYLHVNDSVPSDSELLLPALPELLSSMFGSNFTYAVSNTSVAQVDNSGVVKVTGESGTFNVIFNCDDQEVFRLSFNISQEPFEGEGTATSPYLLNSGDDLITLANNPELCGASYHYLATYDMGVMKTDAEDVIIENFYGTFDGGNHQIIGKAKYPLFGHNYGTISNLVITLANITEASHYGDSYYAGGIANINTDGGAIINCHFVNSTINVKVTNALVQSRLFVGGITSHNSISETRGGTRMVNCSVVNSELLTSITNRTEDKDSTEKIYSYLGSLAGENNTEITNCVALGNTLKMQIIAQSWWTDHSMNMGLWGNKFRVAPVAYLGELAGSSLGPGTVTNCTYAGINDKLGASESPLDLQNKTNDERTTNYKEQEKHIGIPFGYNQGTTVAGSETSPTAEKMAERGWIYSTSDGMYSLMPKTSEYLTVLALPNKTIYGRGESINLAGLVLLTGDGQILTGGFYSTEKQVGSEDGNFTVTVKYEMPMSFLSKPGTTLSKWLEVKFDVYVTCMHKNVEEQDNKVICRDCNEVLYELKNDNHIWELESKQEPTCQKAGEAVYHCVADHNCGETYSEPIPQKEHDWQPSGTTVEASCETDGYIEYSCSMCQETTKKVIEKTGHTYKVDTQKPATCEADGSITYKCENCQQSYTDVIDMLGHHYNPVENECRPATCTEDGLYVEECANCKDRQTKTLDKTGHDIEELLRQEPTCSREGIEHVWHCVKCNEYFHDNAGNEQYTDTSYILAATDNHSLEELQRKEPTCTEDGREHVWHCTECDQYFHDRNGDDPYTDTSYIIPSTGHHLDERGPLDPTCTTPGLVHSFYCEKCGKVFATSDCSEELRLDQVMTPPALGHDMKRHDEQEPTFSADGNYLYFFCERCQKYFKDEAGNEEYEANGWHIDKLGLSAQFAAAVNNLKQGDFNSIASALNIYNSLSFAERQSESVQANYAKLVEAMEAYNNSVETVNKAHDDAATAISVTLGMVSGLTALAALAFVCKFALGR